jgi:hypothetical protein
MRVIGLDGHRNFESSHFPSWHLLSLAVLCLPRDRESV